MLFNTDILTIHVLQLEWIEEPSLRLKIPPGLKIGDVINAVSTPKFQLYMMTEVVSGRNFSAVHGVSVLQAVFC